MSHVELLAKNVKSKWLNESNTARQRAVFSVNSVMLGESGG